MKYAIIILAAIMLSGCANIRPCKSPFPDACRNTGAQIGGDGAGDSGSADQ